MRYLILLVLFVLISCGTSTPFGQIEVTCADVYNEGDSSTCTGNQTVSLQLIPAAHAAILIDAGDISREILINVTQEVTNNTGADIVGWIEMKFDARCNGVEEWIITPKQRFTFFDGEVWTITVNGWCSNMQLGARTLTATAWQPDGVTEIGQVIVSFNLTDYLI